MCAGGRGSEGEAEKRVLMNAVSMLKMENACLVDTLGSRVTEIEALRRVINLATYSCCGANLNGALISDFSSKLSTTTSSY